MLTSSSTEASVLQSCILNAMSAGNGETTFWDQLVERGSVNNARTEDLFSDRNLRVVFKVIASLRARNYALSVSTVLDAVEAHTRAALNESGEEDGRETVSETIATLKLTLGTAEVLATEREFSSALTVLEGTRWTRSAIRDLEDCIDSLSGDEGDPVEISDKLREIIARGGFGQDRGHSAADVFSSLLDDLRNQRRWSIPTGVSELDEHLILESGTYTVLTGTSTNAPRALAINIILEALDSDDTHVLFCTRDMSRVQAYTALLAAISQVDRRKLYSILTDREDKEPDADALDAINTAQSWLAEPERASRLHLMFDHDVPAGTGSLIPVIARIRSEHENAPIVVVYDNLQADYSGEGKDNLFSRTALSSRTARQISMNYNLAFIALSRGKTATGGNRTNTAGVSWSGVDGAKSIESDADMLVILTPESDHNAAQTKVLVDIQRSDANPTSTPVWMDAATMSLVPYIDQTAPSLGSNAHDPMTAYHGTHWSDEPVSQTSTRGSASSGSDDGFGDNTDDIE